MKLAPRRSAVSTGSVRSVLDIGGVLRSPPASMPTHFVHRIVTMADELPDALNEVTNELDLTRAERRAAKRITDAMTKWIVSCRGGLGGSGQDAPVPDPVARHVETQFVTPVGRHAAASSQGAPTTSRSEASPAAPLEHASVHPAVEVSRDVVRCQELLELDRVREPGPDRTEEVATLRHTEQCRQRRGLGDRVVVLELVRLRAPGSLDPGPDIPRPSIMSLPSSLSVTALHMRPSSSRLSTITSVRSSVPMSAFWPDRSTQSGRAEVAIIDLLDRLMEVG